MTRFRRILGACLVALALASGAAQAPVAAIQDGPWLLLAADDVARALGATPSDDGRAFTLRVASGVLTVFRDEPDALWQAAGTTTAAPVSSALPVQVVDGRWFLPEDLVGVLGARVEAGTLRLPGGGVRALAIAREPPAPGATAEVVELGTAVEGLRLFATGAAGEAAVSLLAVDLGLVGLAFPAQQAALDLILRDLRDEKALLLVVTAVAPAAWQPAVYVVQDGRETLLSAPFSVQVLAGDPERVGPEAAVVAVAFLPPDLDVRRPLTLRWAGASGTWTLRR